MHLLVYQKKWQGFHSTSIHNSQELESPKFLSTVEQLGQIVVHSYNGLLQINENESVTPTLNNLDDSWKQYLVKQVMQEHIQYDYNYIKLNIRNFELCY